MTVTLTLTLTPTPTLTLSLTLAWLEAAMAIICSQPSIRELQSKSDT